MIIGHEPIQRFFERAMAEGSLAQAYCFVGPAQVGKRTMARFISQRLLNVSDDRLNSHSDFIMVKRQEEEKTGKLKKDISVAQARALKERLQSTSWLKGYHVIIIDEVELLSAEAGNALLKTLEEPPSRTIFFLLTENENSLLPTIRSRSQMFYFSLVPQAIIQDALIRSGIPSEKSFELAQFAVGRPGLALNLAFDEDGAKEWQSFKDSFVNLSGQPFYAQVKILEKIIGESDDTQRTRDRLRMMLRVWVLLSRSALLNMFGVGSAAYIFPHPAWRLSPQRSINFLDKLTKADKFLKENIHPRLLLETIVLSL